MKSFMFILAIVSSFLLASCGSSAAPASAPATYTIGGTVTNLAGAGGGLQLQDNGSDSLLVNANGAFTFPTPLPAEAPTALRSLCSLPPRRRPAR